MIDDYEYAAKTGAKMHVRIYQCTYSDGIGFLWEDCVGCPDAGYRLVDCEGNRLCLTGTWGANTCDAYNISRRLPITGYRNYERRVPAAFR